MDMLIAIAVVNTLSGFLASSIAAPKGRANNGLVAGLVLGPIGLLIAMGYSWPELKTIQNVMPTKVTTTKIMPVIAPRGSSLNDYFNSFEAPIQEWFDKMQGWVIMRVALGTMGLWAIIIMGYWLFL